MASMYRINRRSDRAKNVEEAFLFFSLQNGEADIKKNKKIADGLRGSEGLAKP